MSNKKGRWQAADNGNENELSVTKYITLEDHRPPEENVLQTVAKQFGQLEDRDGLNRLVEVEDRYRYQDRSARYSLILSLGSHALDILGAIGVLYVVAKFALPLIGGV